MSSIHERIETGHYRPDPLKFVYPTTTGPRGSLQRAQARASRQAYAAELTRLEREVFKRDALEDVGLLDHPAADIIWEKAWEDGHSSGLYNVYVVLEGLADFVWKVTGAVAETARR